MRSLRTCVLSGEHLSRLTLDTIIEAFRGAPPPLVELTLTHLIFGHRAFEYFFSNLPSLTNLSLITTTLEVASVDSLLVKPTGTLLPNLRSLRIADSVQKDTRIRTGPDQTYNLVPTGVDTYDPAQLTVLFRGRFEAEDVASLERLVLGGYDGMLVDQPWIEEVLKSVGTYRFQHTMDW